MNRRDFLRLAGLSAAAAVLPWQNRLAAAAGAAPRGRPNVLFLAVDDLNHWVGYLKRNRQTITPNIDRLASMGVAFTHAYCAAPVCNPSRAALMSGLRPGTSGCYSNGDYFPNYIPEDVTLCTAFRKAGYFVCGAGKIYHSSVHRPAEWDDYQEDRHPAPDPKVERVMAGNFNITPLDCNNEDMPDYKITSYGIEQLGKKQEKPFFLAVGLHKPHLEWNVPRKYYEMHPLKDIELPPYLENDLDDLPPAGVKMAKPQGDHAAILKTGTWKNAIQAYLAATSFCDAQIGRVLEALENSAYKDNTIVVFWGDHGWHLGEKHHWRKFALWEEAARAPFIWVVPGVTRPGGSCERTVDFMGIYPTLCDLCGIAVPRHVEGVSIKPLLENPSAAWTRPAVTTHGYQNHAVRTEQWRYIRYADGGEEFYNEQTDPYEWTNLATNPDYAREKEALARFLPTANKAPGKGSTTAKDDPLKEAAEEPGGSKAGKRKKKAAD